MAPTARLVVVALLAAFAVRTLQSPEGRFRTRAVQWSTTPSAMDDLTTEPTNPPSDSGFDSTHHLRQELVPTTRARHDTSASTFNSPSTTDQAGDTSPSVNSSDEASPRDVEAPVDGNGTATTDIWKYNEEVVIQAVLFLFGVVFFLPLCVVGLCFIINSFGRCGLTSRLDDSQQRRPLL